MADIPNYNAIYDAVKAQKNTEAAPVIQSLESQRDPLISRYNNLIESLKGNQEAEINNQIRTTSREFGRRNIPLSSGMYDMTLQEQEAPIYRNYAGKIQDVGYQREQGLADLALQLTKLRAGISSDIESTAQDRYKTAYSIYQDQLDRERQAQIDAYNRQQDAIANLKKSSGSGGGGGGGGGGGPTQAQLISQFRATVDSLTKGKDLKIAENQLYEFLRAGGAYAKAHNGVSGADVARSLGLDPEQFWAIWRSLKARSG